LRPVHRTATGFIIAVLLAIPAATQAQEPVEVTGTLPLAHCAINATSSDDEELTRRVGPCDGSWSDPRLDGDVTWARDGWIVRFDSEKPNSTVDFGRWALSIENDDGAWRSLPVPFARVFDDSVGVDPMTTLVLGGEGAYDGLVAVLRSTGLGEWDGYIVGGELVPIPENAWTR
jgi:hypothetical protein